ncbi:hypothetical protein BPLS_P3631 [Bathymodiolus platifrons methanotrophic gill symbiont]|uniref:hypothetical protein n=1 Tax=Bathymodiolus platifrons methanotrophic gill symbiont TaxID=113268 RepID=UPI001B76F605|nr:hypothetical protein [Bathymodiolus platifrons methanotrophic gill symbiont]GFO76061.1 hypothetical protein BPLS_P3631 [Bathymodiolus platifrons methanotrophic gill symbiont]
MALVTMTEASRLIGKSKQTLYRHVSSGRVSRNSDGFLDTAELIRVYGELKQNTTSKVTKTSMPVVQVERSHIEWLEKQVDGLRDDIKQVRDDSLAREIRLMALLEHKIDTTQSETSSDKPVIRGLFSKLFK